MNLHEVTKIEEGVISTIRGVLNKQGSKQTRIQDIFIRDFMQDAMASLNNAKNAGMISLSKAPPSAPTTPSPAITEYHAMNEIFENIIKLNEASDDELPKMSVSEFMMNWFKQYMNGVAWEGSSDIVKASIDNFAKDPTNMRNLKKLAQTALALAKAGTPAGAPQEFKQSQQSNSQSIQKHFESIKELMDELAKTYPELYNKFIKTLQPVKNELPTGAGITSGLAEKKNYRR